MPFWGGYRFAGTQGANAQAINCAILVISGVIFGDSSETKKRLLYFGSSVGFLFLILTKSRTSFAAAVVSLVVYKMIFTRSSRMKFVVYAAALLLAVSFLVLGDSAAPIIGSGVNLGRNTEGLANLNGRVWLWEECRGYAAERKWLGYGFNGFWTEEHIVEVSESQGWALGEAHSVFFDVLLELGLIRELYILILFGAFIRSFYMSKMMKGSGFGFSFCFLIFYIFNGSLESTMIHPGFVSFLVMVVLTLIFSGEIGRKEKSQLARPTREPSV